MALNSEGGGLTRGGEAKLGSGAEAGRGEEAVGINAR